MLIIGERINGLFNDVADAIKKKDKKVIQDLALKQLKAGAQMLDVNTGPSTMNPQEAMVWLVESIREVTDAALVIDSPKVTVLEAGIAAAKDKTVINSTTAQQDKLDKIVPLAVKYNSLLIGLTMNEKGIPSDMATKSELALVIIAACMEKGLPQDSLLLDPLILPVNVAQAQVKETLEAIKMIKTLSTPAPQVILGLSNVSQGTKNRSLINAVYLAMAMACGLDGAIVDPMDKEVMNIMYTAEILLNKTIYCDSYLRA
ncbi:MAG: dihydropteroate synthase [Candidatus Omnitrophica bacterium]|nr:dihydropteroate synthase [Candidatus Omnitrophota bacterium]